MQKGSFSSVAGRQALETFGQTRILLYDSEARRIAQYARSSPGLEIGGDLLGFYEPSGNPLILVTTGPGPGVRRDSTHFQQDPEFQAAAFNQLATKFRMFYIGDWHSHHSLRLSDPSGSDDAKLQDLSSKNGWIRLFSIIVQTEISSSRSYHAARYKDETEPDGPLEGHGIWWNAFQYLFKGHDVLRYRVGISFQNGSNPYEAEAENIDTTLKRGGYREAVSARGLASAVLPPVESLSRNEYEVYGDELLNSYRDICRSLSRELDGVEMEVDLESIGGPRLIVFNAGERVTCSLRRRSNSAFEVIVGLDGGKEVTFDVQSDHGKIGLLEIRQICDCVANQFKSSGDQKNTRRKRD